MPVYVDDMRAEFGRMIMCHMVADTPAELFAMADAIGVNRRWCQYPTDPVRIHFDIALTKRKVAIAHGAIPVTWRWVGLRQRALHLGLPVPEPERTKEAMPRVGGLFGTKEIDG